MGVELSQKPDFSSELAQGEFTNQLQLLETSPALWKARQRPLSGDEKFKCQCKFGELRWLATVSRPDIRARLAQMATKVYDLQGGDLYRINDLIKTV